jgi:endonuclease IV
MEQEHFGPIVIHGAYTMNLCSAREDVRTNSREMMRDDLLLLQALLQGKPFILETPNDDEGYREEISIVRKWMRYNTL